MNHFDAIVLGTGGVGSAALMHLAARGLSVLGLDRFPPGHDRGSSHGQTRIIRLAYYEHPAYVPMLRRAYQLWGELESQTESKLYHEVGLVEVGRPDGMLLPGVRASAAEHGLELEELSEREFAARLPGFRLPQGMQAVFERRAGFLKVEACVRAHAAEAERLGARIEIGTAVRSWRVAGQQVEVITDANTFRADRLVIAAGAWSADLLAELAIPLRVLRKVLLWFQPLTDEYRNVALSLPERIAAGPAERGAPCFYYEMPQGAFYGFPQIDERGVKVAEHTGGEPVADPLALDRSLYPIDVAPAAEFLAQCLPQAAGPCTSHAVCMYTMTPDEHFIVDRHPEHPQVVFAAGLSGHGFKFTSMLGEALAELAIDGATRVPIDLLRLNRSALVG
jgi:sarcosine oxidase